MADNKHTRDELRQWQALPLSVKIRMTQERIRQWVREYGEDGVYVSFSGGKDSTVLSHLIDRTFPNNEIPRVFVNTGLEFPEIVLFVRKEPRAILLKPEMNFRKVIEKYGYPFISKEVSQTVWEAKNYGGHARIDKLMGRGRYENSIYNVKRYAFFLEPDAPSISHQCCKVMKKTPAIKYEKETGRVCMTAEMAEESQLRTQKWLQNGCNMYDIKRPKSTPMAFWTEQDVLQYIKENQIVIAPVYGDIVADEEKNKMLLGQLEFTENGIEETKCILKTTGCYRTGCMFCGFGCHLEKEGKGRFERLKITHPKIYDWIFKDWESGGLGYKKVIDWINEHGNMNIRY